MGLIRTIAHDEPLDSVWEDLVYTEARLLSDPRTRDLAPGHTELLTALETVRVGQYTVWRGEIFAQAKVDTLNFAVDRFTETFGRKLFVAEKGERKGPRWKRYFPSSVSSMVRLALERQLTKVRGWPASLKGEPEPELQADGPEFARLVTEGDAAVQGRFDAAGKRNDHRVREIVALIDDVNAARLSALGRLLQRAVKNGLSKDWAESFFRKSQRRVTAATEEDDDGGDDGGEQGGDKPTG